MRNWILILISVVSFSGWAQNSKLFEKANQLYNEGKFAEAIDNYETILESGQHSAALYFNLGNANYKLNNIAPSIYYYEKALLLDPNDKEIQNNLAFARNMTIDAIQTVPEVGFSRIFKNVIKLVNYDTWAKIAIGGIVLFILLFLSYHFSYTTSKKRIAFIISIISLFIGLASVFMAFQNYALENNDRPAIVFAKESRVKAEPNLRSEESFRLHEGTKVQVLDTVNSWKKIKLSDGTIGWIPSQDLKLLKTL